MPPMRFPILFTGLNHGMRVLGLSPRRSWVEIDDTALRVRMGWGFQLDTPLEHVRGAQRDRKRVWGWGVHGWRGRWLVNGSSRGLVRIDFAPSVHARVGPVRVTVRELRVSMEDPEGLVAAIGA